MKQLTIFVSIIALICTAFSVKTVKDNKEINTVIDDFSYCSYTTIKEVKTEANTTTEFITETTEEMTKADVTSKEETSAFTIIETEFSTTETDASKGEIFHITVYIPSAKYGKLTASGETAKHLQTCAVDPKVIPLGSTVYVNGLTLRANDTGSAVKGNVIDIFYDGTESEAIQWISVFGDYHKVCFQT